ncbi:MAG: hypothetical protein RIM84_06270 [Alphaproteobacteria bacterium]
MPEPFSVMAGWWWRFERYEIVDGVIRPTAGAKLERYDPWAAYKEVGRRRRGPLPHEELLELVQGLTFTVRENGEEGALTDKSAADLVAWCNRHGLLGVLSHETMMATLAPRWEPSTDDDEYLVPTQLLYSRTGEGWDTLAQPRHSLRPGRLRNTVEDRGRLLTREEFRKGWKEPGVIHQQVGAPAIRQNSFASSWRRYFPAVPQREAESYRYPAPLSNGFWDAYGEPVRDFVRVARRLREAVAYLETPPSDVGKEVAPDPARVQHGTDVLQALTRTISPTLYPDGEGHYRQEWLATSLVGALALMFLLDLTEQRQIWTCKACGKLFLSKAYQALYCSSTCRYRVQKRRQRQPKALT